MCLTDLECILLWALLGFFPHRNLTWHLPGHNVLLGAFSGAFWRPEKLTGETEATRGSHSHPRLAITRLRNSPVSQSSGLALSQSWAVRAARRDHGRSHLHRAPLRPPHLRRGRVLVRRGGLLPPPLRLLPVLQVHRHLRQWAVPAVHVHLRRGDSLWCFHKEKSERRSVAKLGLSDMTALISSLSLFWFSYNEVRLSHCHTPRLFLLSDPAPVCVTGPPWSPGAGEPGPPLAQWGERGRLRPRPAPPPRSTPRTLRRWRPRPRRWRSWWPRSLWRSPTGPRRAAPSSAASRGSWTTRTTVTSSGCARRCRRAPESCR